MALRDLLTEETDKRKFNRPSSKREGKLFEDSLAQTNLIYYNRGIAYIQRYFLPTLF